MSGLRFARGKPIFGCLGDADSASKADAMIDPRKSLEFFASRTEMAANMKKLLCNFYMHVGECHQSNKNLSTPPSGQNSSPISARLSPRGYAGPFLENAKLACHTLGTWQLLFDQQHMRLASSFSLTMMSRISCAMSG